MVELSGRETNMDFILVANMSVCQNPKVAECNLGGKGECFKPDTLLSRPYLVEQLTNDIAKHSLGSKSLQHTQGGATWLSLKRTPFPHPRIKMSMDV